MSADLATLSVTAVAVGFVHCLCGPDHYVPFVAMSRVGVWSLRKTLLVTLVCGMGHVIGSALLGFVGIALGLIVFKLEATEQARGDIAGWLLLAFGLAYLVAGIRHAVRHRAAGEEQGDPHAAPRGRLARWGARAGFVPWILFVVFLFGPCEPLIPLLMYPAAKASIWSVVWVTLLFGLTTLLTMAVLVTLIYHGSTLLQWRRAEPYGHAIAGLVVFLCGAAILSGL